MKILNKSVSKRFNSFYEEIVAQIGVPKFYPTQTPGRGDCQFEDETPVISLRMDLGRSSFEHHIAHELIHALQLKEGWPRVVSRHPVKSPIVELGIVLGSMVLDLNGEDRLKPWSFDSTQITDAQYRNLKRAILDENVPSLGSLRWCKAAMMYAYTSLTQPTRRWDRLRALFQRRAPHIERKGEELASILKGNGWNTPDQALASLIAVRKSIRLSSEQLGIVDGRTGQRF